MHQKRESLELAQSEVCEGLRHLAFGVVVPGST
jgi:hypothetical protein